MLSLFLIAVPIILTILTGYMPLLLLSVGVAAGEMLQLFQVDRSMEKPKEERRKA